MTREQKRYILLVFGMIFLAVAVGTRNEFDPILIMILVAIGIFLIGRSAL